MATDPTTRQSSLVLVRQNYMLILAGLAVIIIGFILMAGGKSPDPDVFNEKEIYSFRRITLAPIVVLIGFAIEIVAIFRQFKPDESSAGTGRNISDTASSKAGDPASGKSPAQKTKRRK